MSSRQLRKLQQQRELEQARLRAEQDEAQEESEDDGPELPATKASLFANLAALEGQDDEDDDEEQPENQEDEIEKTEGAEAKPVSNPSSKKSKKSKKKKNKKAKGTPPQDPAEESKDEGGEDEIDAALKALNLQAEKNGIAVEDTSSPLDPEYERVCQLLSINSQNLKVANEMRTLFGPRAGEGHEETATQRGSRRQRMNQPVDLETALRGRHAPGKGLPEVTLRRNTFIQGKDHWPKASAGGLSMIVVDDATDEDGTIEFAFVYNKAYKELQAQFLFLADQGVPQNLITLLIQNPYHISTLLQVSKIAKDQSDHSLSSDLVERALFTFGRAATSQFSQKLAEGKARLDFARHENRELWLAGYHYIKSLIMKGTYRTALEWAKLLLSLSPEDDPYCMTLMLHHLALRAQEHIYILKAMNTRIYHDYGPPKQHCKPSAALAAMSLKQAPECRQLLRESIEEHPWLYTHLFSALNLDSPPPSIWGAKPRTNAEQLFSELYVAQCKDLWNTPEAISLLMEVAHACPPLNLKAIPELEDDVITLDVARFVYLDNTPALMQLVPSKLLHRSNNSDSDPLRPGNDEPSAAFDQFYDPLRALVEGGRRWIGPMMGAAPQDDGAGPGAWGGVQVREEEDEEDLEMEERLRARLEAAAAAEEAEAARAPQAAGDGEEAAGAPNGQQATPGVARRLLNLIFGEREAPAAVEAQQAARGAEGEGHE